MILVAAGELFYGPGIVLAFLGAIALVAIPLWHLVTLMSRGRNGVHPSPRQYLPRLLLTGAGLSLVMSHLAWSSSSSSMTVPAVVTYDDQEVVRVKTPGFIDAVHVHAGQSVRAGVPLISLRDHELDADIATLESAHAGGDSGARCRQWRAAPRTPEAIRRHRFGNAERRAVRIPRARVILKTSLDNEDSLELYAGEVGIARLLAAPRPLGDHALTALRDWLEHLLVRRDNRL